MPSIALLQKLGIYISADFMSPSECKALCDEMATSEKTDAGAYSGIDKAEKIDKELRQTQYCDISSSSHTALCNKVRALKPELENFFGTQYSSSFELPKYLLYKTGDFFSPHTDTQLNRKLNITIYLNDPEDETNNNGYTGGTLMLYGLLKNKGFKKKGISVPAKAGLIVAYPTNIIHEVTTIESGSRFAIVSRFLSNSKTH